MASFTSSVSSSSLLEDLVRFRPVETGAGGAFLKLLCAQQGRERQGDAVQRAHWRLTLCLCFAFLCFDDFPGNDLVV
jgi:hypothetical protein